MAELPGEYAVLPVDPGHYRERDGRQDGKIRLADGKTIEPGKGRRNYVDADGTLYTVWVKWVGGQCIYRTHKRVNGSYRVVPDTKWHQTEQAAQAELDIEASVQGWKEEENGD